MLPPLRVVLVEDHAVYRSLLRATLSASPGIEVVGEGETGAEAIRLATTLQPDVIVLDVEMNGALDGVDAALALAPTPCRVLAYSAHDDPVMVCHLRRAGADGYLSKGQPVDRVVEAVRAVARGDGRWFGSGAPRALRLSDGEAAVVEHLTAGGRPGTLAAALGTNADDARDQLVALGRRLGALSWYEVVARAWGADGPGRVSEPRLAYSMRVNVPGQASSARAMSYGA